jgi:hypothetical protein
MNLIKEKIDRLFHVSDMTNMVPHNNLTDNMSRSKTLLEEKGLLYNLKAKRKKIMIKNHTISNDILETKKDFQGLEEIPPPLSKTDQDKKDIENFVNALYLNAKKHIKSLG